MSYTPFHSGAKSPTLDAIFTERMRQIEVRARAALRCLSGPKKAFAKSNMFMAPLDLFFNNGCLIGNADCMGFTTVKDWTSWPLPAAEFCECKKISQHLHMPIACYFLDALDKIGTYQRPLPGSLKAWTQIPEGGESHSAVLTSALFLLAQCKSMDALMAQLSLPAQNILTLSYLLHGPTHVLIDWSDFLIRHQKNKVTAANFLDSIRPQLPVILHLGDYKFRLKSTSHADVDAFDKLVVELDNRMCPLIAVGQQLLSEPPRASMLEVDYRLDSRENFLDTNRKTRITSTKRNITKDLSLLECLPGAIVDRFLGLLSEGQKLLNHA